MTEPLRVLIVEDEWFIAYDHARHVESAGHEVVGPVQSVADATNRLAEGAVDAALLDVQLNGETAFGLADMLLERAIPFAFVTGHVGGFIPPRYSEVPILQKPTSEAEMTRVLRTLKRNR